MRTHIGKRWVAPWRVVLLSMVLGGLVLPGPALAKHEKGHDETSGICPQPRNTVTAPEEFLQLKNPLAATPQNILAGKTLFQVDAKPSACRICHGISGDGLGILFHRVKPKPRDERPFITSAHCCKSTPASTWEPAAERSSTSAAGSSA